jgi:hypothetical protein
MYVGIRNSECLGHAPVIKREEREGDGYPPNWGVENGENCIHFYVLAPLLSPPSLCYPPRFEVVEQVNTTWTVRLTPLLSSAPYFQFSLEHTLKGGSFAGTMVVA